MPQALAAAIVAAIGITGTAAAIATAVIALAITVGLNYVAMAVFGSGGAGKPSDGQRIQRVNVGSRIRHYGKVRVGGQLTFYESIYGNLFSLVTTGHGRINAITEYLLNGKLVTVDGSGLVTDARFQGAVSVLHRLGTDDQTAFAELTAAFPQWTSDHRQRGCSGLLVIARGVKSKIFGEVYEGNREPEPMITLEGSLVYDPRLDSTMAGGSGAHRVDDPATWAYSDNWALCFADYLAHPDGYGLGYDRINWSNVAAEAEICDEEVTTVDARTIALWRVAASYKMADDERRTVVREFLKAADGFMWQDGEGLANIQCGRWIEPSVHIPEKHIIGLTASMGADPLDRANEVRVIYMEPRLEYVETESAPLVDAAAFAALGRNEISRFDCYFCPDHNQAQRVGKRILSRLGNRWQLTLTTNLFGLNVIGERFITVTISELAIEAVAFEIMALKIDPAGLNVEIGLLEVREEDFTFDAETEEGSPPGSIDNPAVPITVEDMEGLTLDEAAVESAGATSLKITATWDAPVRENLIAELEYREDGATEWLPMTVVQDDYYATTGVVALVDGVGAALTYEVRGRWVTITGRAGAWVDPPVEITPDDVTIIYDGGEET